MRIMFLYLEIVYILLSLNIKLKKAVANAVTFCIEKYTALILLENDFLIFYEIKYFCIQMTTLLKMYFSII